MIHDILFMIFFVLPGAFANSIPVFAAKGNWTPSLNKPLDFGKSFRGKRVLGDNKTFRGVFWGYIAAQLFLFFQIWLYNTFQGVQDFSDVDYTTLNWFVFAVLITIGALGGDALKSFFKRQVGIKPGETWIPFDQSDSVIGVLLVSALYVDLEPLTWIACLIVGSVMHPMATTLAWMLKLKKSPL